MAIARRSVGTVATGAGNLNPGLGAGHVLNDIHVCKILAGDNGTNSLPAGWTRKLTVTNGAGAKYEEWWKRDNGSESAPTITRTGSPNAAVAWIECYSGVDPGLADPYRDAQTQTGTGTAAGAFVVTCPALTGVVAGDYLTCTPMFGVVGDTSGGAAIGTIATFTESPTDQHFDGGNEVAGAGDHKAATGSAGAVTSSCSWDGGVAPQWIGVQSALSSASGATFPTAPLPRAFQEQGAIYSGEKTGFQPLGFQIPDPSRAFQEGTRLGEPRAFQDQAFQKPDPSVAFQPEAFDDAASFQMSVIAFQELTGFQADAFQEWYRQAAGGGVSETPTPGGATVGGTGPVARADVSAGGPAIGGTSPSPSVTFGPGGAVVGGTTPSPRATFSPGGVVVGGTTPTVQASVSTGGAVVGGTTPSPRVPVSPGGAVGGGTSPTPAASVGPGGAVVGGTGPAARVDVGARGQVIVGGQLTDPLSGGTSETPPPGGVVVGGTSPTANIAVSPGGVNVGGVAATARVALSPGGALAGGASPSPSATPGLGGVTVGGTAATARVALTPGGVIVGGTQPDDGRATPSIQGHVLISDRLVFDVRVADSQLRTGSVLISDRLVYTVKIGDRSLGDTHVSDRLIAGVNVSDSREA